MLNDGEDSGLLSSQISLQTWRDDELVLSVNHI